MGRTFDAERVDSAGVPYQAASEPPLRLAYFTNRYGLASYTFILCEVEALRARGHRVATFSVRAPAPEEAVTPTLAAERARTEYFWTGDPRVLPGIVRSVWRAAWASPRRTLSALALARRTCAPGWRAHLKQAGYFALACHLARRMRAHGVTHLHNHLGASSASIAMLASTLSGIPYSLTIHGGWIFTEPTRWALGEKIARSAFTVCISDFGRSQCMLFSSSRAWDRLHVVRCGVDASFFAAPALPVPDVPRLVCVGRLSEEKGHLVLLSAVRRLVAQGVPIELSLVGEGPCRAELEAAVRRLALGAHVHLLGLRSAAGVRAALDGARGFVLASFTEGLPVSVMEAFARHRPVIATNVGAVAELVRPHETGWLVSPGAEAPLADAMRALLQTPVKTLQAMGARGAELVRANHALETEIPKLERLFRGALRARGATS